MRVTIPEAIMYMLTCLWGSNKFQIYFIHCWDKTRAVVTQLEKQKSSEHGPGQPVWPWLSRGLDQMTSRGPFQSQPYCEVLRTTTCQLIWSRIRKATGSRKLDRTPLASAQEQNHIKCYYTEVGTELCLLCIGRGTRKLLSPWFWPLQRTRSLLSHLTLPPFMLLPLKCGFMYGSVPLKHKSSSLSPCFAYSPG